MDFNSILTFILCSSVVTSQFDDQNGTAITYPYQTALGLPPSQGLGIPGPQNMGISPVGGTFPYPYAANNFPPAGIPNETQNNYYAMLAQLGRPAYQYPIGAGMGYPQPGIGYPQPAFGYPSLGAGYAPQGIGYPQSILGYQPSGGIGYLYPGIRYPQQGAAYYPQGGQWSEQQHNYGGPVADPHSNIKTEIIDVSPEYQRKVLGWPSEAVSEGSSGANSGDTIDGRSSQRVQDTRPRYIIRTDSQTSNFTHIPSNLTKPIHNTKRFTTSIRKTFVYDSSKPGENKPINIHFINGQLVTTTEPPTTTENDDVEDPRVTPKGKRYMDVPASCPKGTSLAQNGQCVSPFLLAGLSVQKNMPVENTTQAPSIDENAIETK